MKTLPGVDVVIVGGGWTGLLMAKEIGSRTKHSVVVLERGGPRDSGESRAGLRDWRARGAATAIHRTPNWQRPVGHRGPRRAR